MTTPPAVPPSGPQRPGGNAPCWCGSGEKYKRCHRDQDDGRAGKPAALAPVRPALRAGRVSPGRAVPVHIPRPDYATTGRVSEPRPGESEVKTPDQLVRLRRACRAAALVLQQTLEQVRPGITTDALDVFAHDEIIRLGGYPSPLHYRGYPKSICTSVNEVICHGIPDDRPLQDGDIVNVDVTVFLDGMHGDCSATCEVGTVNPESRQLVRVTRECLQLGIEAVKPGRPISDIGRAIEAHASRHGLGTVRAFCGHGIGERFHSRLQIPHYLDKQATTLMEPGMTFTVEPMITLGAWRHRTWSNGWTAVTTDGKDSAQFEHTLLVTERGAEILTRVDAP